MAGLSRRPPVLTVANRAKNRFLPTPATFLKTEPAFALRGLFGLWLSANPLSPKLLQFQ